MSSLVLSQRVDAPAVHVERLHYLDWLRVIAPLGVFLFHATIIFSVIGFHIKNAEQSPAITIFLAFLFPWGMPLFFLIAGAGSWFALQRRTPRQYVRERFNRLLVPFLAGTLLLSPVQLYLEWSHKTQTGIWGGTFGDYLEALAWVPTNPRFFGAVGYHLWFLGFLFCYAVLTLPLLRWLKDGAGQGYISRVARVFQHRGGSLLVILPLLLVRLSLHPFFPYEHDWADFFFLLTFFILGYLLFADERFAQAIQRDWPLLLAAGIAAYLGALAIIVVGGEIDIEAAPRALLDFVWWGLITVCSWCWTALMLFLCMRFLNRTNPWLRYGQEAILPFYVLHHPAIIVISYFVVQWPIGLLPKLLVVVLGALAATLGLHHFIIRRIRPLRLMFGMKA